MKKRYHNSRGLGWLITLAVIFLYIITLYPLWQEIFGIFFVIIGPTVYWLSCKKGKKFVTIDMVGYTFAVMTIVYAVTVWQLNTSYFMVVALLAVIVHRLFVLIWGPQNY